MSVSKKITFVVQNFKQYRAEVFDLVQTELAAYDLSLLVISARPTRAEQLRGDNTVRNYSRLGKSFQMVVFGRKLLFQYVLFDVITSKCVILTEGVSNLHTPFLMIICKFLNKPVAMFGHGKNFQTNEKVGWYKRWLHRRADLWFAYTESCRGELIYQGVDPKKIVVFNNSVATHQFPVNVPSMQGRLGEARREICFLGSVHRNRNIDYLASVIRFCCLSDCHLTFNVIGDGEELSRLKHLVSDLQNVKYHGYLEGEEKIKILNQQLLLVCPEMLGLNTVDAIYSGTPVVTRINAAHSPEVDYLVDGLNSVFLEYETSPSEFATTCMSLLCDSATLNVLHEGMLESRSLVSGEVMRDRLVSGIRRLARG